MNQIINEGEYGFFQQTNMHDVRFALRFTPHLVVYNPEPIKLSGWGYTTNRRVLCRADKENPTPMVYTFAEIELRKSWQKKPLIICERCWKKWHKLQGVPAPVQERPKPFDGYDVLPTQEVVAIGSGSHWMPYAIIQSKEPYVAFHSKEDGAPVWRERKPQALSDDDVKADGQLKQWSRGHQLGVDRRFDGKLEGQYALYDEEREALAGEVRAEIARLKRQLAEAEQHLLETYEEGPAG